MKKFFGFLLIMFALLFCYSCTENEEMTKQTDKLTYELSFKFAIEDPEVKGIDWDMAYDDESEAAECPDPDNFINTISGYFAVAYLDMSGDESITRVVLKLRKINDLTGHSYISTVPVALAAKTGVKMYLNRIVIVKDLNANGELDVEDELVNSNIVYSTLNETSPYKEYVDILTPIELSFEGENSNLVAFNKREIGVQVFCAVKATPAAMGYAMFTLDAVKSYKVYYSINICENPCGVLEDEFDNNQHKIAVTKAVLQRLEPGVNGKWVNIGSPITHSHELTQSGYSIGTFTFTNKGSLNNKTEEAYEVKIIIDYPGGKPNELTIIDTLTVDQLINFDKSGYYQLSKVYGLDKDNDNGIIHFDLCDMDSYAKETLIPFENNVEGEWPAFKIFESCAE